MNKTFILTIFFSLITILWGGDDRLHLVHADKTSGKLENGEQVRLLAGNVQAWQDTMTMTCDTARFYENRNLAIFQGHVVFNDGHHVLQADKVEYFSAARIAKCYGNVRINGKADSLFAQTFIYHFKEKEAQGKTDLFILDKENNVRIFGDSGSYISSKKESKIRGHARFEQAKEGESDTLVITSKFMSYSGLAPRNAVADDSVIIQKGSIRAVSDSAVYFMDDEKVWLRLQPTVWQQESKMTGEHIDFVMDSLEIKQIFIHDEAKISTLADSVKMRYNILRGKTIQVDLVEKQPNLVIARKNASSVYVLLEDSLDQGTNASTSDSIYIFFKAGQMDSISIMGGIEGTYYPAGYKGDVKSEF